MSNKPTDDNIFTSKISGKELNLDTDTRVKDCVCSPILITVELNLNIIFFLLINQTTAIYEAAKAKFRAYIRTLPKNFGKTMF